MFIRKLFTMLQKHKYNVYSTKIGVTKENALPSLFVQPKVHI